MGAYAGVEKRRPCRGPAENERHGGAEIWGWIWSRSSTRERIRDDFVGGSSVGPIPEVCGAVVVSGDVCLSPGSHDGSNRRMKRVVGQRFEEKKTSSFITEPRELLVKPGDHAPTSEVASNHAR
jgi:hypothetical protein